MKSFRLAAVKVLQTTKLNKLVHRVYYHHFHGFDAANRSVLPAVETCFQKAVSLGTAHEGDYYEFGIFKGYTFWHAQQAARKHHLKHMRFFGFDSFAGLPEVQGHDETKENVFYEGQYSCSKEDVVLNLNSRGVDWQKTFLVEGYFEESLTEELKQKHQMKRASIILIDCDLYSSTVDVLKFVQDLIGDNTILMFDDWNCFDKDDQRGQRRAFKEFLEQNPQVKAQDLFTYGLYGQVFIVHLQDMPKNSSAKAVEPNVSSV